jgi:hypothetical protein
MPIARQRVAECDVPPRVAGLERHISAQQPNALAPVARELRDLVDGARQVWIDSQCRPVLTFREHGIAGGVRRVGRGKQVVSATSVYATGLLSRER